VQNPSEPSVLARARTLVRASQVFDTLHIMLAALTDPVSLGPAGEVLGSLDDRKRDRWVTAIQTALLHGAPVTFNDTTTTRYRQCEEIWRREALSHGGLTNTLVLATIVANDSEVATLMQLAEIDRSRVVFDLQARLGQPDSAFQQFGSVINTGPLRTIISGPHGLLGGLVTPVDPTPGLIYKDLSSVASNHFLNELGSAGQTRAVPIVTGYDGSPLPILYQILADSIAFRTPFTGQRAPLTNYTTVYQLDISQLKELAVASGEQTAHQAFETAKQLAQNNGAILMLDHLETVKGTSPFEVRLRTQAGTRGETLMFGVFWAADHTDPTTEAATAFALSPIIRANPYTPEETKDFLRRIFIPQWDRDGYLFTPDAFDSIIVLESGAWINRHRKRLPYLVIDVATDTMETAHGGESSIKATAQEAANALAILWRTEWPPANMADDERRRLENTLRETDTEVRRLVERPTIVRKDGKVVLTRAHVVAQLVCPNESEYHVPGHAPAGARRP